MGRKRHFRQRRKQRPRKRRQIDLNNLSEQKKKGKIQNRSDFVCTRAPAASVCSNNKFLAIFVYLFV